MILDTKSQLSGYAALGPRFTTAIDWLQRHDLAALAPGHYEIDGDQVYAIVADEPGVGQARARLEAHLNYIDIQYIISGPELIGWRPTSEGTPDGKGYDAERDIEFFTNEPAAWIPVRNDEYAILFPADAHAPMAVDHRVHKIVVKIRV